jgi:peptidoglycan/xylan/chitin deacetylase (PgdA/CDA1 family)
MHLFALPLSLLLLLGAPAGPSAPQENQTPIIEHGPRDSRKVALTFDACRTSLPDEYDEQVIDVLVREKVQATIFISGKWADREREKTKYLASLPQFEIGNHAYWHPHLLEKDDARVLDELRRTQVLLKKLTGKTPKYFRAPYGEVDQRIAKLAGKLGLTTIQYDLASGDPDPKLSVGRIERVVLRDARGGSIIVFHANRHGVHTAEVLPVIISGLRKKGYELVTVGELLASKDTGTKPSSKPKGGGKRRGKQVGKTVSEATASGGAPGSRPSDLAPAHQGRE